MRDYFCSIELSSSLIFETSSEDSDLRQIALNPPIKAASNTNPTKLIDPPDDFKAARIGTLIIMYKKIAPKVTKFFTDLLIPFSSISLPQFPNLRPIF